MAGSVNAPGGGNPTPRQRHRVTVVQPGAAPSACLRKRLKIGGRFVVLVTRGQTGFHQLLCQQCLVPPLPPAGLGTRRPPASALVFNKIFEVCRFRNKPGVGR